VELGADPSAGYANLRNRLDVLATQLNNYQNQRLITMGGDLEGVSNDTHVVKLNGHAVSSVTPLDNYVMTWNDVSSQWEPKISASFTAAGDLFGNASTQTVIGLQGRAVASTAPTNGQALVWNSGLSSWAPATISGGGGSFTAGNDLAGTDSSQTVVGLRSRPLLATAPTSGQAIVWNGSAWAPADLPLAASGVTGIVRLTGNLGGTATSPTVTNFTISGATTGSTLYYNGSAWVQLTPGTIGQILTANGAAAPSWNNVGGGFTAGGDLTGSSSSQNVVDLTITGESNGSMLYFNGTNWVNRSPGTANYLLTANGAGAPTWNNAITGMTNIRGASYTMQANSGSAGSLDSYQDFFSTTSNTQFTARTLSLNGGFGYVLTCVLTGIDAYTGDGGTNRVITITKTGKYYRQTSVSSLVASGATTVQDITPPYGDTNTCDLSLVIVGNTIEIKVTGEISLNAKWQLETYLRTVTV